MKHLITLLTLLVLVSCGESSSSKNITLSCSCINNESTDNYCFYNKWNPVLKVNFETNSISFNNKDYTNLKITPSTYSAKGGSSTVSLGRGDLKATVVDYQYHRHVLQCNENKI